MRMLLLAALFLTQRPTASLPIQTGTVTGRLLNADGSPAVKVRVSAMAIPDSKNANDQPALITLTETDSTGRYRLVDVPVGRYYIVAGFVDSPTYYPRGTVPSGATPVNVTTRGVTANIDFQIEKPSTGLTVSGRVILESPPIGGSLQVILNGGPSGSFTNLNVPVKLDGAFEFLRVRPGTYSLMVSPTPYFQPRTVVVSEKDVTGLVVRVPWTGEVTGRVVVEGGDPVPTIQLAITGENRLTSAYPTNQTVRTTLQEGFYGVVAQGIPTGFYVKSITSGATNLLSEPLRVSRTRMPPEIVVTLGVSTPSPWVKLSGRITGSRPSGMSSVTLNGPIGTVQAAIAGDGSFEFPKLLPGTYNTFTNANNALSTQPLTIVMPNRDLAGIELALPATKEISGRILVEDGGPLPRPTLMMNSTVEEKPSISAATSAPTLAQVLVVTNTNQRSGPMPLNLNIQPDGTFKASVPVGEYQLSVGFPSNGGPPPYSTKSFTYGSTDLLKDPLKVTASDSSEMRLTVAAASGTSSVRVSGRVVLPTPTALTGPASVTMYNPALFNGLTTTLRPDGAFEFPKVYSGTYQLRLTGGVGNLGGIPSVDVSVGATDITNIEIVVPRQKEISGTIVLEGRGVIPQLNIPLTPVSASGGFAPTTYASINPRSDGTFKTTIPEGERQVGRPAGLPPGYTLKSFTYGSTDLMSNPLKISASDTAEFRMVLSTPDLPTVKVSGKVSNGDGVAPGQGAVSVSMNATGYGVALTARVAADGSFEFPAVFPGAYTARVIGGFLASSGPAVNVTVADRDVTGVELVLPRQKEIVGRIALEGRGPMPTFSLQTLINSAESQGSAVTMPISPQPDGTFRVNLPEGERRVQLPTNLPAGYTLKAITYGSTDLLAAPMRVTLSDAAELRITVATANQTPVKVTGRVSGMDSAQLARRPSVTMNAPGYAGSLLATIASDGSFEFPEVFPATYIARVTNIPGAQPLTSIVVTNTDVRNVEIVLPGQKEITGRVVIEGSAPIPRFAFRPTPVSQTGLTTPLTVQFINITPSPDGTFRVTLPEGERFLGEATNLPGGYKVKAATYGSTDLLVNPLKVAKSDTAQLVITLSASAGRSPVTVMGRVDGLDATALARGDARVGVNATEFVANFITTIRPDGSFTFPSVFPGNYTAQVVLQGQPPWSPPTEIVINATGANDIRLVVPRQLAVSGRIDVEGGGPLPRLPLTIISQTNGGTPTALTIGLNPEASGIIRTVLPEGNRTLRITQVPPGYALKSLTYGGKDLRQAPLSLVATDPPEELRITLEKTTPAPWVRVSGKVVGLPAGAQNVRVNVTGSFTPTQQTVVNADGTFSFSSVFQGPNTFQFLGTPGGGPPTTVTIGPKDVTDLEVHVR